MGGVLSMMRGGIKELNTTKIFIYNNIANLNRGGVVVIG